MPADNAGIVTQQNPTHQCLRSHLNLAENMVSLLLELQVYEEMVHQSYCILFKEFCPVNSSLFFLSLANPAQLQAFSLSSTPSHIQESQIFKETSKNKSYTN